MSKANKILWINSGKIRNKAEFSAILEKLVKTAQSERGTRSYWWSATNDSAEFFDIDCYDNEAAALEHLEHWADYSDAFMECATINKCIILGDVPNTVKSKLSQLKPRHMEFYGGFSKNKPQRAEPNSDIIWSLEGKITDRIIFEESMDVLTAKSKKESGSLTHWWCTDGDNFFVLEHYLNQQAAMKHLKTWSENSHLFMDSTSITKYRVYSTLTTELSKAISGLNPELLSYIAGFSK